MPFPRSMACAIAASLASGCGFSAHDAGVRAATGAEETVEERYLSHPEVPGPGAQRAGRGAVKGIVEELDTPALREEFRSLLYQAAMSMAQGALREATQQQWVQLATENALRGIAQAHEGTGSTLALIGDQMAYGGVGAIVRSLGAHGDGRLAHSLTATAEDVSAASIRGAQSAVFEECQGPGRAQCIDRRLAAASRALASGVRDELHDVIEIPLLVLTFIFGMGVMAMLVWISRRLPPRARQLGEPQ